MKSIELVRQFNYVVTRCAFCKHVDFWHSVDKTTGKPRDCNVHMARRWALEDGWSQSARKQMVCPDCTKAGKR